jgi:hypothetical protein
VFLTVFIAEQGYCYPLHKALLYSDITKNSVPIILKTSPSTNNCIVQYITQYQSSARTVPFRLQLPTKIIYSRRRRQIALITNLSNFHLLPIYKHQTCRLRLLNHRGTEQTSQQTPSAHMSVLTSINYEVFTQTHPHGLRLARMQKP